MAEKKSHNDHNTNEAEQPAPTGKVPKLGGQAPGEAGTGKPLGTTSQPATAGLSPALQKLDASRGRAGYHPQGKVPRAGGSTGGSSPKGGRGGRK
jgi:hypothetical protein